MRLPSCTIDHSIHEVADALTDAEYLTIRGIRSSARRKHHGAGSGRPGTPTLCKRCGETHPSLKATREHLRCDRCAKRGKRLVWVTTTFTPRRLEWLCTADRKVLEREAKAAAKLTFAGTVSTWDRAVKVETANEKDH